MNRIMTMDDGLAFLQGQLEWIDPEVYDVKYRDIRYAELVPMSSAAGPNADAITYESIDRRMKAKFLGSGAMDVPLADVTRARETIPVEHAGLGYQYSLQELRQSQEIGKPLDVERAKAVQRGVDELAQEVCFLGSAAHNLPGFLNNADIPSGNATNGTWSTATAAEILEDVNDVFDSIWTTSKTVELADTLLLPPSQFSLITTKERSSNSASDDTVFDYIMKKNLYTARTGRPLSIEPLSELEGLGAGSTDRMVGYRRDPSVLTFHFPMPLRFIAPQPRGLAVVVPGEFRLSGVQVRYPLACAFADGI